MLRAAKLFLLFVALFLAASLGRAQSPAPIVVEAASSSTTSVAAKPQAPATKDPVSLEAAIRSLEEMKAANAELLKKQQATLQRLDELQQAAEQLKIFSKRG
jgi:hypothetical protein